MTYGALKKRIAALLDLDDEAVETEGSLVGILNARISPAVQAVARKVAVYLGGIEKQATLHFVRNGDAAAAPLPSDCVSVLRLRRLGKTYGRGSFVTEGRSIRLVSGRAGDYELTYYAYPVFADMEADADTETGLDDFASDTIAYGAAAELCCSIYPGDMTRYMRLITEFEERLANALPQFAETGIADSVFGKGRGIL